MKLWMVCVIVGTFTFLPAATMAVVATYQVGRASTQLEQARFLLKESMRICR